MPSRRAVLLSVAPLSGLAGCLHGGDDSSDGNDSEDTDEGGDGGDGQSAGPDELGTWAGVSDRMDTRPTTLQFTDTIRFDGGSYADDVVWEARSEHQFLLVTIERRVTSAPEDDLVAYPDPFAYRVAIDGEVYDPREGPAETNVIDEPLEFGGYASGGSRGTENVTTTDWLAFEIPAGVAQEELVIEYTGDDSVDRWSPEQ